jgi:hypothetical protein
MMRDSNKAEKPHSHPSSGWISYTQLPSNSPFSHSMAQPQILNGYSKLASLMGAHSDLANFRRFSTLNAQNLLYLQAELVFLENKLGQCVEADKSSGHVNRGIYDRDWQALFESGANSGGDGEQWDTVLQIRKVLKEYSELRLRTCIITCSCINPLSTRRSSPPAHKSRKRRRPIRSKHGVSAALDEVSRYGMR